MKRRRFSNKQKSKILLWEDPMRILLASLAGISVGVYADVPSGILGGETSGSASYAALVFSSGALTSISGLPATTSEIYGVAINATGTSLIGGLDASSNGYAAFVSPTGMVTSLPVSFSGGTILSTSINDSGAGLIGGTMGYAGGGYAAVISSDGTVIAPSLSINGIHSVSLNSSGVGLIGGEGLGTIAYAAFIIADGTISEIPDLPSIEAGVINGVAINDLGNGIIGGYSNSESNAYAAFVTFNDGLPPSPTVLAIESIGTINSVAINSSGVGLVGGNDTTPNLYAAYAATDDTITPLFEASLAGFIQSVAINESGTGLIGGQRESSNLYAALVLPNRTVTPLISGVIPGIINSVAINDAGVGLIGGQQGSEGYAALVAPNGMLTTLNVSSELLINGVALNDITSSATPQSSGPYLSAIYTHLAAISALDAHFVEQNRNWIQTRGAEIAQADLAHNEANLACNETNLAFGSSPSKKQQAAKSPKKNSIWIAPFGDFVYLKDQGVIPSYSNEIGGVLLAYDYQGSNYLLGASLGYAFNYIHYSSNIGHAKLQEEMACFYGAYYGNHFRFTGALWGGIYQLSNTRHTLSIITSTGKTDGWILDPHIEFATPWAMDKRGLYLVEPFCMFDWINSWQSHFTESGTAGFNLKMGNLYGSLLQSEAGLRFYERFAYGWGDFNLEEKVSYVNQAPFHFNAATTSFVGSASTFSIAVGSSKVENLGALQLTGSFVPKNSSYPFGGFSMQTTANSSYQSYFVSLFSGINF